MTAPPSVGPTLPQKPVLSERSDSISFVGRIFRSREIGVFAALVLLAALVSAVKPNQFLDPANMFNLARQISFTAIVAIGVLFVILTGGVDLSLGSTVGVTGYFCGQAITAGLLPTLPNALSIPIRIIVGLGIALLCLFLFRRRLSLPVRLAAALPVAIVIYFIAGMLLSAVDHRLSVPAGILVGVLTGAAVGAVNGSIVSYVGVTPFIVTLGMLSIGRSVIYLIRDGANIGGTLPLAADAPAGTVAPNLFAPFIVVANGRVLGIPVPFLFLIAVAIGAHIVLKHSVFGRRLYAIGGNEEATHLSGINVSAVKFFAYVVCSSLCAITGLLYIGRFRSAVSNAGVGMELDAIAAAVIGGTSLMGGQGSVLGVLIGASIMGVVNNAITLMGIKSEAQGSIIGIIIIAAAILDVVRSKRGAK